MAKITQARRLEMERQFPELKMKRMRARMGLTLALFSAAIFATLPFYGPEAADRKFHIFSVVIWLLPLAFFVIYLRARKLSGYLESRIIEMETARSATEHVTLFLANYNVRSGRGFSYRVTLPGRAPEEALNESTEFVNRIGYSEKGGEEVEKKAGQELFDHKMVIKPLYRKYEFDATAYTRVGYVKPFLLTGPDNLRLWLDDRV